MAVSILCNSIFLTCIMLGEASVFAYCVVSVWLLNVEQTMVVVDAHLV
jgi:hypothetical protein